MSELPKTYDPKSVEDKLYKFWVDSGFFHAEGNPDKKPYTSVIPPPNVTGQLHIDVYKRQLSVSWWSPFVLARPEPGILVVSSP